MNKIKIEEMDLTKVSEDIVNLVSVLNNRHTTFDERVESVEKLIKEKIINILEPESVYTKGEYYEGLGYYIGIVDTYPWNSDYFKRQHHFRNPNDYRGVPSEI